MRLGQTFYYLRISSYLTGFVIHCEIVEESLAA